MSVVDERWTWVLGLEERYSVSDQGRLRSHLRNKIKILSPGHDHDGYPIVVLTHGEGRRQTFKVPRVVMTSFIGPRPEGMQIRHLNGDKDDNRLINLQYGTPKENVADTIRHGRHPEINRTHCPQHHPYDEINTRRDPKSGARLCRTCDRERQRKRRS